MSRIGKSPIFIPKGVFVEINKESILVKGPLGELSRVIPKEITLTMEVDKLIINRKSEDKKIRSFHGLYQALIKNMIVGVSQSFKKNLELIGVGYRASSLGQRLDLSLGYSHNIILECPKEIKVEVKAEKGKNSLVLLSSYDKQLLGMIASFIRSLRPPEPYKGKGVRYENEEVRKKAGKTA